MNNSTVSETLIVCIVRIKWWTLWQSDLLSKSLQPYQGYTWMDEW